MYAPGVPPAPDASPGLPGRTEYRPAPGLRPGRPRRLVFGAITVLAAALAAVVLLVTHPFARHPVPHAGRPGSPAAAAASGSPAVSASGSPAPDSALAAASSLATLLARSAAARNAVNAAVLDVSSCGPNLNADAQAFQAAVHTRQRLLGQLAVLPGRSALPQSMLADLASGWQASGSADAEFAAWARDEAAGCSRATSEQDGHYKAADEPDSEAKRAKKAFVRQWKLLARPYGLTTYDWDEI